MNFSSLLKGAAAALALASVVTLAGCGGDKDAASSAAKSQAAGSKTYIVATRGTFRPFTYVDEKGNADRSKRDEFVKLGKELIGLLTH